jgi:YVTN family beta-propeller protein
VGTSFVSVLALLVAHACSSSDADTRPTAVASSAPTPDPVTTAATPAATPIGASVTSDPVATDPPLAGPTNIYAATAAGMFSPAVAGAKAYLYVPSNDDGSVTVIDQATRKVVDRYRVGKLVQHVVPSWDLRTLYAAASGSSELVPIDPATGRPGTPIPVDAPYNVYFTPDGRQAVVMAERRDRIDYYDPHTWQELRSVSAPCRGVNHADWSADGTWFVVTCEFSGQLLKVDTGTGRILQVIALPAGAMPQDIRLAPDGEKFYVADMMHAGVWILSARDLKVIGSIHTGVGAHGIYPSRDGRLVYVSNRGRATGDDSRRSRPGQGSVSVVDPSTDQVVAQWPIPGGGSPDMGGVSADGRTLWLSGRYDAEVYGFNTRTGALVARIPVPAGPHGLCVFPQPGRFSLGHTGNYR